MLTREWRIPELVDLEFFLHKDAENQADDAPIKDRDRNLYLTRIQPLFPNAESDPPDRRALVRAWLAERRRLAREDQGGDTPLPGETVAETRRLLAGAGVISGLLVGAGLAFSLLTYTGVAPLNVSVYLGVLVLPQLLLLLLTLLAGGIRKLRRSPFAAGSVLVGLVGGLLVRLSTAARNRIRGRLSGERREALEALSGLIRGKRRVYAGLFSWPLFRILQVFGIGFNIGALTATVLRIVGSDVAFGWQSTVQFSPEVAYEAVRIIALPWSWLLPAGIAHPGLAEIEGSRIVLKEGIYHLATTDLVSWWPFLLLTIVTYGLLPRLLLWGVGVMAERRGLARLAFDHASVERLLRRMQTPRFITEGRPSAERPAEDIPTGKMIPETNGESGADKQRIALIPEDIYQDCAPEELRRVVENQLGYPVGDRIQVDLDPETDRDRIADLARRISVQNGAGGLLILQEAWQPPIREHFGFLKALREAVGERVRIDVGLIGRPGPSTIFTPPAAGDREVWRKKMMVLGDPYLRVERLVPDGSESDS